MQTFNKQYVLNNFLLLISATFLLIVVTVWSYWPIVTELSRVWHNDDNYSAGQLVPMVAIFLVWHERKRLKECPLIPYWRAGVIMLIVAETTRVAGLFLMRPSIERYALVLAITGLVLLVVGWQVFRRLLWILIFLLFMVPLPSLVHTSIAAPLQRLATVGSVFALEVSGVRVSRQGNTMVLNGNTSLGVVEACSGLRMLTAFIIVAAFLAYMVKRSRRQKVFLLLSSIPVALLCNILRIVVTAVLMLHVSTEVAQKFFHDFAGLIMMPAAVMLMFGELWLMNKLTVSEPEPLRAYARARAKPAVKAAEKRINGIKQST